MAITRTCLTLLLAASVALHISCATPGDIASLEERVKEEPDSVQAHYYLALAYVNAGLEWEGQRDVGVATIASKKWVNRAMTQFEKVMELDPKFPEPHYWLKVIYNAEGKYEEADREAEVYVNLTAQSKRRYEK
ncbi:MAG: hypothetical protein GY800_04185 [Planctomycetes bacterium]|nr:hypothetical protein [Planctomycetota bacterium]